MSRVYILSGARTPVGALDGNLRDYQEHKLGAAAMKLALELAGFDPGQLSEIVAGAAKQTSRPSNLARYATLEARLPDTIPAYTVQRQSASGLQAVANGVWSVKSGMAFAILAGGCESMTHIPREIHDARFVFNEHTRIVFDPVAAQIAGAQPEDLTMRDICARLAEQWGALPKDLDAVAAGSAEKAAARTIANYICKMQVRKGKAVEAVETDEANPAAEGISRSADAAAMLLLGSEAAAEDRKPLAEILSVAVSAGDPDGGGLLGIDAAEKALEKAGLNLAELDRIEIVEMSAAQVFAALRGLKLQITDRRINPLGGGLATGSPWGASGTVHLVDMAQGLAAGQKGILINPAEGGQAMCAVIQRI
jgi:acetyl-CoA C-acetyltransferase